MAQRIIRGISSKEELSPKLDRRDVRTMGEKFRALVESGEALVMVLILSLGTMIIFPQVMELIALISVLFFWWATKQKFGLAFKLPVASGLLDYEELDPKGNPKPASGIAFLGNEIGTKRELWFSKDDLTTHILCFGSTGAGKALKDNEPILTPTGWKTMIELKPGDQVLTPDRQIATIEGVYPQGMQPIWKIEFDDGREIETTPDHLWGVAKIDFSNKWSLADKAKARLNSESIDMYSGDYKDVEVITTDELEQRIFERFEMNESEYWAIPLTQAVGDTVVMWDKEVEEMAEVVQEVLSGLKSADEFPVQWMEGSVKQRQATWSTLKKMATAIASDYKFESNFKEPLKHIQKLAWSLGFWAKIEESFSGYTLIIKTEIKWLKINTITPLHEEHSCRCIKISDPQGLFITRDWIVTHNTETLISLAYNALVTGSGFIYVDGKGDNELWAKIFSVVRYLGREDDLLIINFMTGGKDMNAKQKKRSSNTLNPFITGSAAGLTELIVGLMDEAGGDNAMWKGRAISLISAIMLSLVYLRDHDGQLLGVDLIREYLLLENLQKLSKRHDLPPQALQSLKAYLRSLPGYQENAPKQSETVMDQHGYLQMQFTRILGSLSETYGYIFKTNLGEVDFFDVVLNRRILVVLLPAMEKSTDELSNLGKIIIACLKQMMATGLGNEVEGDREEVIDTKPTKSKSAFMCILDEYGYYVVKGASVMPAQARSLGFCMVFAGQDYPAFKKNNNAEEAVSTIGNCNIKIFMKLEDPTETFDLAEKSIGEGMVGRSSGLERNVGSMTNSYYDQKGANMDRRKRADWLDFKDHGPGEAHIIFKSTLVRANMFYAQPENVKRLQLNSFLRVEPPHHSEITEWDEYMEELKAKVLNKQFMEDIKADTLGNTPTRLKIATEVILEHDNPQEAGMAALAAIFATAQQHANSMSEKTKQVSLENLDEDEDTEEDMLHIFRKDLEHVEEEENEESIWQHLRNGGVDNEEEEEDGDDEDGILLDESNFKRGIHRVERSLGMSDEEAARRSESIASDMRVISAYPKNSPEPMDTDEFTDFIEELDAQLDPNRDNYSDDDDDDDSDNEDE